MLRVSIIALCLSVAASGGVDEDLAQAAKSPYDIARFVDSHVAFRWEPLWKALGVPVSAAFLEPCDVMGACSVELITVLVPFQVILLLRHEPDRATSEVYLRFLRSSGPDAPGPWSFGGYYTPPVKYFEPQHRTLRFGQKPFLVVTRQGVSGSDWASSVEDWMDLTSEKFG